MTDGSEKSLATGWAPTLFSVAALNQLGIFARFSQGNDARESPNILVCMWVCMGLSADVGLVLGQQQGSLGADPGMMSLPGRPRSRSYLCQCLRSAEPGTQCVCVYTHMFLYLCADKVIVSGLCLLCVTQALLWSSQDDPRCVPVSLSPLQSGIWGGFLFSISGLWLKRDRQTSDRVTFLSGHLSSQLMWFGCWRRRQSRSDRLIQLVFLQNGNNKIHRGDFPIPRSLWDVRSLSDGLHVTFVYPWQGRGGEQGARERNHWSASQCLCLCLGFPLSLFPLSPTTASSFRPSSTPRSLAITPSTPLKHNSSQRQQSPSSRHFPLHRLSVHLPTLTLPPVFVLQSGSRRGPSGCWGGGKPVRWSTAGRSSELQKKERLWYGLQDFPSERRNPDVCASFIEKEFALNAHTVQQHTCRILSGEGACKLWKC